uniref:Uncharacterized protein n=1 Tax=Parascaris equorum TaxID=6256 RepID=A0A914RTW4_PAREQ
MPTFATDPRTFGSGAVMTFWVGPFPLVMVNEPDAMKKYFVRNSDIFSNRWRNYVTDTFMGKQRQCKRYQTLVRTAVA